MKIGIEYEFTCQSQNSKLSKLTRKYSINLNQYIPISDNSEIEFALDTEYYDNQYEIKFKPFNPTKENIKQVQDFINELHEFLPIQNPGPAFVGTHIHIFRNFTPEQSGYFNATEEVFKEITSFMKEYASSKFIHKSIKKNEFLRLITSNNLLKFFDRNYFENAFKALLSYYNISFQYSYIGNDREKYKPCLWSPERQNKQKTFEIRYIPNSYFLLKSPEDILNFINRVNNHISTHETATEESITHNFNSITQSFYELIQLFKYITSNDSGIWNPEKEILKSLPAGRIRISRERLHSLLEIDGNRISDSQLYQKFERGNREEDEEDDYDDTDDD